MFLDETFKIQRVFCFRLFWPLVGHPRCSIGLLCNSPLRCDTKLTYHQPIILCAMYLRLFSLCCRTTLSRVCSRGSRSDRYTGLIDGPHCSVWDRVKSMIWSESECSGPSTSSSCAGVDSFIFEVQHRQLDDLKLKATSSDSALPFRSRMVDG
jgi:hypothetical protein